MQLVGGRKRESFTRCCNISECLEWGIKMPELIYGVALNNGQYPAILNNKNSKEYSLWKSMLQRCYCQKYQKRQPTYIGCSVSDNFKSYSYFYEWVTHKKGFNIDGWQLDKDIVFKGNKIYSEYTCFFVPREINAFFNAKNKDRGIYPLGVCFNKKTGLFRARCNKNGKSVMLGDFRSPEKAHHAYKNFKENLCKELANKWKDKIDGCVYEAMMVWSVQ